MIDGFELIERNRVYLIFKDLDLVGYGNEDDIIHTAQYEDLSDLEKKRLSAKMGIEWQECLNLANTSSKKSLNQKDVQRFKIEPKGLKLPFLDALKRRNENEE